MKRLPLVIFLLLTLAPTTTRAQGEPPSVLDPDDIFTDAVEVVETLPIFNWDNEARKVWYFDPELNEWRGYAYPEELEITETSYVRERSDETQAFIGGEALIPTPEDIWIFNPASGDFSHPDFACGWMKDLPGEGRWKFVAMRDVFYLCFTETGEMSNPFPNDLQSHLCERSTIVSPNHKWLVFFDCERNYSLYSFELATREIRYLGTGEEADNEYVVRWLDNQTFLVSSSVFRNNEFRYLYIANASEPESMELIASQWVYHPQYFDDPPRYIWISESSNAVEFTLEARQERVLSSIPCNLARCEQVAIPNAPDPTLLAILDGHPMDEVKQLSILDTESGHIRYTTTFSGGFGRNETDRPLIWLNENTFILFDSLYRTITFPDSARLVMLTDEQVAETIINYLFQPSLSPSKRYLLLDDVSLGIDLYEIEQGALPIIQPLNAELYDLRLNWQEDDLLLVTISDSQRENSFTLGRWLIRIPDVP